jgi:hypothetical protein
MSVPSRMSPIGVIMGKPWIDGMYFKQYHLGKGVTCFLGEFVEKAKPEKVIVGKWFNKKEIEVLPQIGSCYIKHDEFYYLDEYHDWRKIIPTQEEEIIYVTSD